MEQKNQLVAVKDILVVKLKEEIDAIPKGFNDTRFIQNCIAVLRETKDIAKCNPESIALTLMKGAYLGLDFFNKTCWAIPYNKNIGTKDKPIWEKQLQFQTSYTGDILLAKKYSPNKVKDVYAKVVKEGDSLDISVEDGKQHLSFKPLPFNDGKVIGAFAVVYYSDGAMIYDTMSVKDIGVIRKEYSKAPNSKAWLHSFEEMAKKVIIKRVCKLVTLNFDNPKQAEAFQEGAITEIKQEVITVSPVVEDAFKAKELDNKDKKDEPKEEKAQDQETKPQSDRDKIIKIRKEIEDSLKTPSKIYKYSTELMGKPLAELNLAEVVELKSKIEKENPNSAI